MWSPVVFPQSSSEAFLFFGEQEQEQELQGSVRLGSLNSCFKCSTDDVMTFIYFLWANLISAFIIIQHHGVCCGDVIIPICILEQLKTQNFRGKLVMIVSTCESIVVTLGNELYSIDVRGHTLGKYHALICTFIYGKRRVWQREQRKKEKSCGIALSW